MNINPNNVSPTPTPNSGPPRITIRRRPDDLRNIRPDLSSSSAELPTSTKKRSVDDISPETNAFDDSKKIKLQTPIFQQALQQLASAIKDNPDPQFIRNKVNDFLAEALTAFPYLQNNKATAIRMALYDPNDFNPHQQLVKEAFEEIAYPLAQREADHASAKAFAAQKYPDNETLQHSYIGIKQELNYARHGIIPSWVEEKRRKPKTEISLARYAQGPGGLSPSTFLSAAEPHLNPSGLSRQRPSLGGANPRYKTDDSFNAICAMNLPGVGLRKGGVNGVVNIISDGVLFARWYGIIQNTIKDPSLSAGEHGPIFCIFKPEAANFAEQGEFPTDQIQCFLTYEDSEKSAILEKLALARDHHLITPEEYNNISAKVFTYKEYVEQVLT